MRSRRLEVVVVGHGPTEPDGVHLIVVNEYDEPVSVEGFDADPGRTRWVLTRAPGAFELMCWPSAIEGLRDGDELVFGGYPQHA